MITREFDLMLYQEGNLLFINANQYDSGEQWIFTLYEENGVKYTPATGAIVGVKSDGHGIINTGTVDEYGRVVINETQQMTAAAGLATFELLIDNDTHGTANFKVDVEPRPADNADLSDSDLSLIQQAVDSAEVIVEVIGDGDPSEVIGEHVDAWLDAHPEATTTVVDGAITAPKLNNSLWDKLLVSEEASGAVASFDDGADDVPVSSLKVNLEPIQTGTGDPSPTNIRPISGHNSVTVERTGKNLLDINNITQTQRCTFTGTPQDFTLTATGTYCYYQIEIPCKANQPVTVNFDGTSTGDNRRIYVSHPNAYTNSYKIFGLTGTLTNNTYTFTPTEDAFRMTFYVTGGGATTGDMNIKNLQAEYGSEATEYEPFVSNSYPYALGREVYGGSVDLATGVLTVDKAFIEVTETSGFSLYDHGVPQAGGYYFGIRKTFNAAEKYSVNPHGYFSHGDYSNTAVTGQWRTYVDSSHRIVIVCLSDTDITSTAEANAFLQAQREAGTPLQVVYPLITPTTVQLTPQEVKTLLGYNNISSSGTVDVIYHADTKLYVDKEVSKAKSIIAGIEAEFKATKNYTTGDLLIIGDDLYKCTANIANGSTITVNTNVTKTTVAEQLIALA